MLPHYASPLSHFLCQYEIMDDLAETDLFRQKKCQPVSQTDIKYDCLSLTLMG